MKRKFLLMYFMFCTLALYSQSAKDTYIEAMELYERGSYENAASKFIETERILGRSTAKTIPMIILSLYRSNDANNRDLLKSYISIYEEMQLKASIEIDQKVKDISAELNPVP